MKNEEAIHHLCCGRILTDKDEDDKLRWMCIEALEKQIPKKPKLQVRSIYDDDNDDWLCDEEYHICPTCRIRHDVYRGWKHCPECGQLLDWSEVK